MRSKIMLPMGLFIKWGSAVKISEALTLYTINQTLKNCVPVPEVYGWRTDGEAAYIYMEHIRGTSLQLLWDTMEPGDRATVCDELRDIIGYLRQLQQDPADNFVGEHIPRQFYTTPV